jgi:hypothetical protein
MNSMAVAHQTLEYQLTNCWRLDTNVIIWKPTDVKQVTYGSGNADYEKESWVAHAILR